MLDRAARKIIPCGDFNLSVTMESGQVFGFEKTEDGFYSGVISGRPLRIRQNGDILYVQGAEIGSDSLQRFFDLGYDLNPIYERLYEISTIQKKWFNPIRGLRLIQQDAWEALAGFILSSNNNVKRIQGIHQNLNRYFMARRKNGLPGFPEAYEIANCHERILRELGLGYRAPYLQKTAQFISVNPAYLDAVRHADYAEAVEKITAFPGIGPKVADCVLLYGFHRLDAFPVDVWILRVMRKLFFKNRKVSESKIHQFGRKRWGVCAGYIQQYLFHSARTGILSCL